MKKTTIQTILGGRPSKKQKTTGGLEILIPDPEECEKGKGLKGKGDKRKKGISQIHHRPKGKKGSAKACEETEGKNFFLKQSRVVQNKKPWPEEKFWGKEKKKQRTM